MARGVSPILSRSIHESPGFRSSPGRNDSPSRQLLPELDFYKKLAKLNLHDAEQQKVYYAQKCAFQDELDAREEAAATAHESEIASSKAQREQVRQQAEAALQAHIREEQRLAEANRRRQEEEDARRKAEAERRAREEEERKVRERTEQEEAAKRAEAEKARQEQERQKRRAEEAQRLESERQEQERQKAEAEAESEARAAKQRSEEAKKAATPALATTPTPTQPSTGSTSAAPADIEQEHKNYLVIHKRLKKFRVDFVESCKSNKPFRAQVGEMRRGVRVAVGQLRLDGVESNKVAMQKVWNILGTTLRDTTSPRVPVNDYLPAHHALPDNSTTLPALTIYILSILAKAVINVSITSCIDNPKAGEAPGVLTAQIFAHPDLSFARPTAPTRVSLISILLCKYHAAAPQLFGINGSETHERARIGWRAEPHGSDGRKAYVMEQTQYDRLVGLAASYAAVSLRNFSRAKNNNPYPPRHFWASLAHLVNTPPEHVQVSQLILLKSLLENSVERVVQFFGATGIAALRQALVVLPSNLPEALRGHSTVKALEIMRERWAKDLKFHLV